MVPGRTPDGADGCGKPVPGHVLAVSEGHGLGLVMNRQRSISAGSPNAPDRLSEPGGLIKLRDCVPAGHQQLNVGDRAPSVMATLPVQPCRRFNGSATSSVAVLAIIAHCISKLTCGSSDSGFMKRGNISFAEIGNYNFALTQRTIHLHPRLAFEKLGSIALEVSDR